MATLLVYIPAYENHLALAIHQAKNLRAQWNADNKLNLSHKIEIYLSINGLNEELNLPEGIFDN